MVSAIYRGVHCNLNYVLQKRLYFLAQSAPQAMPPVICEFSASLSLPNGSLLHPQVQVK